jgi:hypothetical protein
MNGQKMITTLKEWYFRNRIKVLGVLFIFAILINIPPTFEIDPKVKKYVDEVVILSRGNLRGKTPIMLTKLEDPKIATCHFTAIRYIKVDPKAFFSYSEKERTLIIAHELMHCECGIGHKEKLLKDLCPSSIMYPSTTFPSCTKKHWKRYVKELREVDC